LLARWDGDLTAARAALQSAVHLARVRGDRWRELEGLVWIATIELERGQFDDVEQRCLDIDEVASRIGGSKAPVADALRGLAQLGSRTGEVALAARKILEAGLDGLRAADDKAHLAHALNHAAALDLERGDVDRAAAAARAVVHTRAMSTGHAHDLSPFVHEHHFHDAGATRRARALWQVTWITLLAMVAELAVGWWSGSLALLADGWHMGTHAFALGGAAMAMHLAQRARHSQRFAFGGWKIEMLAAYTSGLLLLVVSVLLVIESLAVLRSPRPIAYAEAIVVAAIGLAVNLLCAWRLADADHAPGHADDRPPHGHTDPRHGHGDGHGHAHSHGGAGDVNFRAAMLHVVADALTSVLAIAALAGGLWQGWRWLDPAVALVAALVIGRWALGVLHQATRALVDATADAALRREVRERIESDGDAKLADLHVWQVGPGAWSAALSLVADRPLQPAAYRLRLQAVASLRHVTVEVNRCSGADRGPLSSRSSEELS